MNDDRKLHAESVCLVAVMITAVVVVAYGMAFGWFL